MKAKITITLLALVVFMSAQTQTLTFELTFSAVNNSSYVQLDSIYFQNLTQNCDTVLFWPDTVLVLDYLVKIKENIINQNSFHVYQNYPNPFHEQTSIDIYLPKKDLVILNVFDLLGRKHVSCTKTLENGLHTFEFTSGNQQTYILSITYKGRTQAVKMLSSFNKSNYSFANLEYVGTSSQNNTASLKSHKNDVNNDLGELMPDAIIITPTDATAYDELTLTFDPEAACFQSGSLAGLDSIAIHSGVTFEGGNVWQNVVEFNSVGYNGQATTLYSTGDGRFAITYIPSEFYGLNGEVVTQICAVFNNGTNWLNDGRDFVPGTNDCDDFYIPLNTDSLFNPFQFDYGDVLRYIGYANTVNGISGSDVIDDAPIISEPYIFNITEGIPCIQQPLFVYYGQTYHTVQIGNQCWFKENLNIGNIIPGGQDMLDNNIIEKYCYNNNNDNCGLYGGLYQWDEMMQYLQQAGTMGICPVGWHLPSDEEWCTLLTYVDSTIDCEATGWNGTDAGMKLKSTYGWYSNGNGSNNFGFEALPAGSHNYNGNFNGESQFAHIWSSTYDNDSFSWSQTLTYNYDGVYRSSNFKLNALSVRCVRYY